MGTIMKIVFQFLLAASMFGSIKSLAASNYNSNKDSRIMVHEKEFTISISHEEIIKRIKQLAKQISKDYVGKKPIFVGVLNGAFIFLADLVKEVDLELECEIDFIKISSYGNGTQSSGTVNLVKNTSLQLTDRDVIIVEDIIDSGRSIEFVQNHIANENPRSIRIAALLHKNISALNFPIDYIGFKIQPEFVIGYGLDYAQVGRNLKNIYKLVP